MSAVQQHAGSEIDLVRAVIGPFGRRGLGVLALVVLDTVFASLGIGMVFPVFQALIDPAHSSALLDRAMPALKNLAPDSRLVVIALTTVTLFGLKAAISMLTTVSTNSFLQSLRFHWVARIGESYLYGPHRRVSGKKSGELFNDWFNETLAATRYFQSNITFFSSSMLVAVLIVMGLVVDWQLMLGMIIAGGAVAFLVRQKLFLGSAVLSQVKVAANQAVSASMIEDLTHVRDLKLLQAEAQRLKSLDEVCNTLSGIFQKSAVFAELPRVIGEFLTVLALMAFVVISVSVLDKPPSDMLPLMAFFFIAFYRLAGAGSLAMASKVKALNEVHSVAVVRELLAQTRVLEDKHEGLPLDGLYDDIRLRGIHYAYDADHSVLAGITATIPRGRTSLLVGPSGSGKSTLLDLLMRLEEPQGGSIEVAGENASAYRLADWRCQFGYVSQEAALFNGDIRMNLRLAAPEASNAELEYACHLAGADDFIRALPNGYETLVGDRGYALSGGQRKRIAIARALIRKPAVLILDEATTSFEQSLEQNMLSTIRTAMPGMTIIQVTHRLANQSGVDWVVALRDGKVVREGNWDQVRAHLSHMVDLDPPRQGEAHG